MIVRVAPAEHYPWIAERAQLAVGAEFQALEAVNRDGRIVGMVAFDSPTPNALCMHVALEHPAAARYLILPAFKAAFVDLDRAIVYGQVLSNNPRALALDLHLGFREIARFKDCWAPGVDKIWLEMRREECRWLTRLRRAA